MRPVWVGLSVAAILLLIWASDVLVQSRLRLSNILFVPRDTSGEVVIIAADKASLEAYGERSVSVLPLALHAQLVDIVSAGNARVIAFDLVFDQPSDDDDLFIEAITRARTVEALTPGTWVVLAQAGAGVPDTTGTASYNFPAGILAPTTAITDPLTGKIALGHTNAFSDPDGTMRWHVTQIESREETALSFGLVTYLSYLGLSPSFYDQMVEYDERTLTLAKKRTIPIDEKRRALINFWGPPGTFTTYSFRDVIDGNVDPAAFDEKIVLVGLMNHITSEDTFQVPINLESEPMAGVEIHANIIETLIQDKPLYPRNEFLEVALIINLSLIASLIYQALRRSWVWLAVAMAVLIVLWFLGALTLFNIKRQMIDLLHPLLALALPAPAIIVMHSRSEIQRRQQAELLLGSIVTASGQRLSLASILPGIANDMQRILRCTAVEFWLWDKIGKRFKMTYTVASIDPVHEDLAFRALQTNERITVQNRLAVPLTWQGTPLGVLIALHPERLTRSTTNLLNLFTWQTASIIANAIQHEEIQNLSDLKTRMIRLASHDLKNPLTVILGYLHLMNEDYDKNSALPRHHLSFLNMMNTASETMLTIINDILDLERVKRGALNMQAVDLLDLLNSVIDHSQGAIEQKRHTFRADLPVDFPTMIGDQIQLREVFSNLISNAIKYTPENGHIWLRLKQIDGMARIEVQDDGLGISKEAQENLFQEFYRVRTMETADIEGTGLGLSLVKAVVEAHEGRVWVESDEGQGSTFFTEIPIPAPEDLPSE